MELFFTLRALFSREQENSPDQLCHWLGGFTPSPAEAAFTEEFLAGAADCQRGCFFAEKLPSH